MEGSNEASKITVEDVDDTEMPLLQQQQINELSGLSTRQFSGM